jgi:hypothetical protein
MSECREGASVWLKQLQSLFSAALPLVTAKLSLYPFQNVVEDLWPITSVLALLASAITFNMMQPRRESKYEGTLVLIGWLVGLVALVLAVVSLLVMLALVREAIQFTNASDQYLAGQFMFVSEFFSFGLAAGFVIGLILRQFPAASKSSG